MDSKLNSKAQVTIFIIIGVVIVGSILAVFLLRNNLEIEAPTKAGPQQFIRSCIEDSIEDSISKILDGGGKISPEQTIQYKDENYHYLCYQADPYLGCYNLNPLLEKSIEEEIETDTKELVQECFELLKEDFSDKGYFVKEGKTEYSIDLLPGIVEINLKKKIDISRENTAQSFENFNNQIISPLYELVGITRKIVNDESEYCSFDYVQYMSLYPERSIRKISYIDSKIYYVLDRDSGEEFRFAIRGCASKAA